MVKLLLYCFFSYNRGRIDLWGHGRVGVQWREEGSVLRRRPDRDSLRHSIVDRKFRSGFPPPAVKSQTRRVTNRQWRILLLLCRRLIVTQRLYCRGRHQHRPDARFAQTTQSDTRALSQPFWKPGICQKGKSWIGSWMVANNSVSCFNVWSNFMQLSPLAKTKRSSSGKSFPPLGPDTKVFVVWVERFDDIGRNWKSDLQSGL